MSASSGHKRSIPSTLQLAKGSTGRSCNNSAFGMMCDGGSSSKQRHWWPAEAFCSSSFNRSTACARSSCYSPLTHGQTRKYGGDAGGGDDELSDLLSIALSTAPSSETEYNTTALMEIANTGVADSTATNVMENSNGSNHVGLQPQYGILNLLTHNRDTMGVANVGVGRQSPNLEGVSVALDYESNDASLISRRIMCRSPDNVNFVDETSSSNMVTPVNNAYGFELGGQQHVSPFSVIATSDTSIVDGKVDGNGGAFGAMPVFSERAAWVSEAVRVLYVAVFLTPESRDVLLSMVPPMHPLVSADHMTLAYKPSVMQLLDYPLGASVELRIIGTAADSRAQAVAADPPPWLPPTTSVSTHVTISVAFGAKAAEAGHLIMDALQRTATADPAGPFLSGAGTYRHFEEALPLIGTLGVKLALPSREQVLYSIDDLVASGWLGISNDIIAAFHEKHAAVLGNKALAVQCDPTSMLNGAVSSASSRSTGAYSPLNSVAMPPLQLPPPLLASTDRAAVRSADSVVGTAATLEHQCEPCNALGSAECVLNNQAGAADDDVSSTDTGSSGSDAVQFRSAVHVGDYVALRPFVLTRGGDRLVQGYVREFACDDAFQGNGVMVVLADNTIGFVTAVLDPVSSSQGKRAAPAADNKNRKANKRNKGKGRSSKAAAGGAASGNLSAVDAAASDAAHELSEWALTTRDTAAASAGLSRRNAEDAQRDMLLWSEFDALQHQHGEALCTAILQDCSHDFVEAIATIKAQVAGFAAATVAAASVEAVQMPQQQVPDSAGPDEELVQQLALSLGLSGGSAVQLCKLVPHVPAERAIEVLQQQGGDVNKAADVLLSTEADAATVAPVTAAATTSRSPVDRAAAAMVHSKDATLVVSARNLCVMFPSLQQDMAELLLQEHGSLEEAARAVSDMQTNELQARTAAAACVDSPQLSPILQPWHPSEEDQMAMLAAMGELEISGTDSTMPAKTAATPHSCQLSPPHSKTPPQSPPLPPAQHTPPTIGPGPGSAHGSFTRQRAMYGSPPRYSLQGRTQQRPSSADNGSQEAKLAAKAAADKLYTKSKTLQGAVTVYMTAAQALLAEGDMEGYKEKKAAADKARAESKAAFDEAQRLSWSANNKAQQTWQVDLHGLGTSIALRKFVSQFELLAAMDNPGGVLYQVIVGKGKHSEDNVPKIKLGVLQYLEEKAQQVLQDTGKPWQVDWRVDPTNEGLLTVYIPGGCSGHEEATTDINC